MFKKRSRAKNAGPSIVKEQIYNEGQDNLASTSSTNVSTSANAIPECPKMTVAEFRTRYAGEASESSIDETSPESARRKDILVALESGSNEHWEDEQLRRTGIVVPRPIPGEAELLEQVKARVKERIRVLEA